MDNNPVISLFSGAGGLDLAVDHCATPLGEADPRPSPFKVAVATDYDANTQNTFHENFPGAPTLCGDIRGISTSDLMREGGLSPGDAAMLIGGPPCTPFSKSGFWIAEKRESRDPNASLLDEYVRVVRDSRPESFILENVQGLTYSTHKAQLSRLISALSDLGYNPQFKVLSAADYGVPQLRKRLFVVGRRDGQEFKFPPKLFSGDSEHTKRRDDDPLPLHITAGEALAGLASAPEDNELVEGQWGEVAAEVPPGENYLWHTDRKGGRDLFQWRSRYWTFLLRLSPNRPSSTIQAQPGPWVGPFHWENLPDSAGNLRARRLRVPEIKRLMTFPDSFQIVGDRDVAQRQLGNAVPLELGKAVVRSLGQQLGYLEPAGRQLDLATPL